MSVFFRPKTVLLHGSAPVTVYLQGNQVARLLCFSPLLFVISAICFSCRTARKDSNPLRTTLACSSSNSTRTQQKVLTQTVQTQLQSSHLAEKRQKLLLLLYQHLNQRSLQPLHLLVFHRSGFRQRSELVVYTNQVLPLRLLYFFSPDKNRGKSFQSKGFPPCPRCIPCAATGNTADVESVAKCFGTPFSSPSNYFRKPATKTLIFFCFLPTGQ